MGDRDARISGFCAEFDGGRDGRGPGSPKPLNKLKIAVWGGPGSGPDFLYSPNSACAEGFSRCWV